jgi:hypothetical protein
MKKIFNFLEFITESSSEGFKSMSLDEAIAITESNPKAPKNFLEFLQSDFAKKFSTKPFFLISNANQIKNGTFIFATKESRKKRGIGIFENGYIRTYDYEKKGQRSSVIMDPWSIATIGMSDEMQLKTSMSQEDILKFENRKKNKEGFYASMAIYIEEKLDLSAPLSEFPKFKSSKNKEFKQYDPVITVVNSKGEDIKTVKAEHIAVEESESGMSMINMPALSLRGELDGAFIDGNTVSFIGQLDIKNCKMRSSMLTADFHQTVVEKSDISNSIINTKNRTYLSLKNSIAKNVRIMTQDDTHLVFTGSDVEGMEVLSGRTPGNLVIESSNVNGFKFNHGSIENLTHTDRHGRTDKSTIGLILKGIRIADSDDLASIVIECLNFGQGFISSGNRDYEGNRARDENENRYGHGYIIEDCDFTGVDLSKFDIDPEKWPNENLFVEFAMRNKGISEIKNFKNVGDLLNRAKKSSNIFGRW